MSQVITYEAGVIYPNGRKSKFIESTDKKEVTEYIEIMIDIVNEDYEIYYHIKTFNLVSTVPHIVNKDKTLMKIMKPNII